MEGKLMAFENKVLKKVFEPVVNGWIQHKEESRDSGTTYGADSEQQNITMDGACTWKLMEKW